MQSFSPPSLRSFCCFILILGVATALHAKPSCEFELQQSDVVAYGDLLNFPGVWNNKPTSLLEVDQKNGNILLYPQVQVGGTFTDVKLKAQSNTRTVIKRGPFSEPFMFFGPDGTHKWTAFHFSTITPLIDDDVYVASATEIHRLAQKDGSLVFRSTLCHNYKANPKMSSSEIFWVRQEKSGDDITIGILMSKDNHCELEVDGKMINLTSDSYAGVTTPYLVTITKSDAKIQKYLKLQQMDADFVKGGFRSGTSVHLIGMKTDISDKSIVSMAMYKIPEGTTVWKTKIETPHPHNLLWSKAHVGATGNHILYITDPTKDVKIGDETIAFKGLVFGGLEPDTGKVAWKRAVAYEGIITSTFIQYLEDDLVILGAIWDGENNLDLGDLEFRKLDRPVQGMIGLIAIYDVATKMFLYVMEVAPELAFPGHHIGTWKMTDSSKKAYQIASCPAFWDNAPQRLVDDTHSVALPEPDTDSVVLVRWHYTPCRGTSTGPKASRPGSKNPKISKLWVVVMVLIALVVVTLVAGVVAMVLMRSAGGGLDLPSGPEILQKIFFWRGRDYNFLDADDDDTFAGLSDDNDPL